MIKLQISDWFRSVQIDSSDFRLDFQISDWLQIHFRFIPDSFQTGSLKIVKNSNVRLFQIGSDSFFRFQIGLSDFILALDCLQIHLKL